LLGSVRKWDALPTLWSIGLNLNTCVVKLTRHAEEHHVVLSFLRSVHVKSLSIVLIRVDKMFLSHEIRFRNDKEMLIIEKAGLLNDYAMITIITERKEIIGIFDWAFATALPGIALTHLLLTPLNQRD
jgi:hypothetical protein